MNGPGALGADIHGHLFVIEMITNQVRRIDLENGAISTVAGNGKRCCYKDERAATAVSLGFLRSLAVDSEGDIFIGDEVRIKKVDARTGLISTVAGNGESGETLDGIAARAANFWEIDGLAIDAQGNLFVSDGHQDKIFEIDAKTLTVHRFAGTGKFGYDGDGQSALHASFRFPAGISVDRDGNLIVADFENCAIRKIDGKTGLIKTIGRTETEQNCLAIGNSRPGPFPSSPVSDMAGDVYFAEGAMDLVLELTSEASKVVPFAGNGNRGFSGDSGPATDAELANPSGLAIDPLGNVFISEYINNRVRRVDAKTRIITTVAGNGLPHRIDIQM
jgi:DNA-binding beta-propeller fold protein YncE